VWQTILNAMRLFDVHFGNVAFDDELSGGGIFDLRYRNTGRTFAQEKTSFRVYVEHRHVGDDHFHTAQAGKWQRAIAKKFGSAVSAAMLHGDDNVLRGGHEVH